MNPKYYVGQKVYTICKYDDYFKVDRHEIKYIIFANDEFRYVFENNFYCTDFEDYEKEDGIYSIDEIIDKIMEWS